MRAALLAALMLGGFALPAAAQDATVQELRLRQLEAQVRDLQRQVQPGVPRTVAPQTTPGVIHAAGGAPAASAVTDMLARMDALEAQVARLTSQNEELANRLRQIEGGVAPQQAAAASVVAHDAATAAGAAGRDPAPLVPEGASSPPARTVTAGNLSAMTGGASTKPDTAKIDADRPAETARPAKSNAPVLSPAKRLAAVKAVVKPQTADTGDDEYTYGYRLYDAKLYPEAVQQLRMYLDKYPRHADGSKARNLLGRALLDDGKPRDAAPWFLQNYKADPKGARAADSLLGLAEAMHQLGDSSRACVALGEFATNYPADARGRLKSAYEQTRAGVSCN